MHLIMNQNNHKTTIKEMYLLITYALITSIVRMNISLPIFLFFFISEAAIQH